MSYDEIHVNICKIACPAQTHEVQIPDVLEDQICDNIVNFELGDHGYYFRRGFFLGTS